MPESEISKDQTIEHLRRQVNSLCVALQTIDNDVDRAAARYLNPTVPIGQLRFSQFLDLLVREIERSVSKKWRSKEKVRVWVKEALSNEMKDRFEAAVKALMPSIQKNVSEYVTIPVLLRAAKPKMGVVIPPFMAVAIRTKTKHGRGDTLDHAYADLRERLALALIKAGPNALGHFDQNEWVRFEKATPYRADDLEGFKLEVRIEEAQK